MRSLVIAALAVSFICTGVFAEDKNTPTEGNTPADPTFCPVDGYKFAKIDIGLPIPDCDPAGTGLLGPLVVGPPGGNIADVIIDLEIDHTWVGDLIVNVHYDVNCDGQAEAMVSPLCRPNLLDCPRDSCCGCSADLLRGDKYWFGDNAIKPLGEDPNCSSPLPFGCYMVAPESPPLASLAGLPKDGCWWIEVVDGACADTGTIWNFSVHILNDGSTPVEEASWGSIKSAFND